MNIVSNAGPIGGGIILPEDFDRRAAAHCHIENEWYQMRFWLMGLAPTLLCTGYIEVTKAGVT